MDFVEKMSETLDDFNRLQLRTGPPKKTFMEITKYPHYENVCSNILAFFLDPEEPHGLGTLMFDAFLAHAGSVADAGERMDGEISVETEVPTDKSEAPETRSKRIDVLIMSDEHAVLIENKLRDKREDNPYDKYTRHLDKVAGKRRKHKLLLSIEPMDAGKQWGFENLRYDEFVKQIRSMLGQYISGTDIRYLTLFLDFLNTLENLRKGTRMDPKFIQLLMARGEDVAKLSVQFAAFKKESKNKVKDLSALIDLQGHQEIKQSFEGGQRHSYLYEDLIHDIPISEDLVVRVETSIFLQGWEIWNVHPVAGPYDDLKGLLQELEIPFDEYEIDGGVFHRDTFVHRYDEDLDNIRELLQGLINKLAAAGAENR
ncbi:hypothetical protein BH24ACT19_BH24ACT19_15830 [soil metagenome]|jgi:hypothetical protein